MRLHSLLSACLAALLLAGCDEPPKDTWQGYAEGDYVRVAPIDGGLVEAIGVQRGDRVKAGDLLFRLETTSEEAALEGARATLAETKATLREAELDLQRKLELRKQRNVAQAELDTARARRDRAGAATLTAASALDQAKWRLSRREGHAPADAIVQDVFFREGEFVNPSQPVVSLLPPQNIKVRFFVPESELSHLEEGARVRFACSDCPQNLTGTIRFVSTQAEFTPPVIYSDRSKEKLVYMAEATPDKQPELLHPGQPVTVTLATPPAAE
ncbi:MAG: efflux RND transporter periplasmic adaptor subunit [Parvibaculum sp.]|jgi:HlyD family secretion protein|uniref:HlyD family secretion protein n=1 Tax=Parvibaculum sp. TaxID=2024848 RepID=UPI0032EF8847